MHTFTTSLHQHADPQSNPNVVFITLGKLKPPFISGSGASATASEATSVAAERETEDERDEKRTLERLMGTYFSVPAPERKKRKRTSVPSCSRARKKVEIDAWEEVESTERLDKLPKDMWEKILDKLEDEDLFPLALSCKYFRQKQKELVARTRQNEPESNVPRLALRTNLWRKLREGQPASAEYLRFCNKEKGPLARAWVGFQWMDYYSLSEIWPRQRAEVTASLAAYHGHLPLLQELLKTCKKLEACPPITLDAGVSSFPQSLFLCFDF